MVQVVEPVNSAIRYLSMNSGSRARHPATFSPNSLQDFTIFLSHYVWFDLKDSIAKELVGAMAGRSFFEGEPSIFSANRLGIIVQHTKNWVKTLLSTCVRDEKNI